ncbi:MAG: S41 family peptidase [Planctomycetota bacterium]
MPSHHTPRPTGFLSSSVLRGACALAATAIAIAGGCRAPAPAATSAPEPATLRAPLAAETFDAVWTTVRDQHFDAGLNGVDWNAVRDELRPAAIDAASTEQLRGVLMTMLGRLGQSHFTIIPGADDSAPAAAPAEESAPVATAEAGVAPRTEVRAEVRAEVPATTGSDEPGLAGADIALVDGAATVLRVFPGRAADKAGLRAGFVIESIDGTEVESVLAPMRERIARIEASGGSTAREARTMLAVSAASLMRGDAGDTKRLAVRDGEGEVREIDLALEAAPYGSTKFGNLPALPVEVDSRIVELPIEGAAPAKVGVLSFNIWMTGASDAIDAAVDTMRSCDGIVIDLRGNPGGVGAMSMGVAGHFLRETKSLGSMIGRSSTLDFNVTPRRVSADGRRVRPYAKPLAIVLDGRSASTSEVFAGGLQDLGRARVFGETSAGMALPAQAVELPNGDVLMHAVADFVTSKGTRLEGRGVVPDEAVAASRAALLAGADPALDAAGAWIARETVEARARRAAAKQAEPAAP